MTRTVSLQTFRCVVLAGVFLWLWFGSALVLAGESLELARTLIVILGLCFGLLVIVGGKAGYLVTLGLAHVLASGLIPALTACHATQSEAFRTVIYDLGPTLSGTADETGPTVGETPEENAELVGRGDFSPDMLARQATAYP